MNLGMYPGLNSAIGLELTGMAAGSASQSSGNVSETFGENNLFQNLFSKMMHQLAKSGGLKSGKMLDTAELFAGTEGLLDKESDSSDWNSVLANLLFSNVSNGNALLKDGTSGLDLLKSLNADTVMAENGSGNSDAAALLAGLMQGFHSGAIALQNPELNQTVQNGNQSNLADSVAGVSLINNEKAQNGVPENQAETTIAELTGTMLGSNQETEAAAGKTTSFEQSLKLQGITGRDGKNEGIANGTLSETELLNQKKAAGETEPSGLPLENSHGYQNALQGVTNRDAVEAGLQVQPTEKTEAYSQIGKEILSKLEQKGPMEFTMQLQPEDLGQIDIKLKLNDGKLMIDIMAASARTQNLLANQVDKLIMSMGLSNVQVEHVQVNQQMNNQSQDNLYQSFTMNAGLSDSHRRQQEQFQEQMKNQGTKADLRAFQISETAGITASDISQRFRSSRRLDYVV